MTRSLFIRPMTRRLLPLLSLVVLAGIYPAVPAQAQDSVLSSRIREQMQPFIDKNEVAGAVTLVGSPEGVVSLERSAAGTSRRTCRCGPTRSSASPR